MRLLKLSILIVCLSSCNDLGWLDWHAGHDEGYIQNEEGTSKIYTDQKEFNEYGCLHVDQIARLARYINNSCSEKEEELKSKDYEEIRTRDIK
jgi:hypothetical protein